MHTFKARLAVAIPSPIMPEFMDYVDEHNKVVGSVTKEEIYERKLPHRIVHVLVMDSNNRVYLQKRSETVSFLPGYYCSSAAGHVRSNETYEDAAKRELKEEIGIVADVHFCTEFKFVSDNHVRFIQLFIARAEKGFSFVDGEVSDGQFFTLEEASDLVRTNDKIHPQLGVCVRWLQEHKNIFGIR